MTPEDSQGGMLSFVISRDHEKSDGLVEYGEIYPVVVSTLQHEDDAKSERLEETKMSRALEVP